MGKRTVQGRVVREKGREYVEEGKRGWRERRKERKEEGETKAEKRWEGGEEKRCEGKSEGERVSETEEKRRVKDERSLNRYGTVRVRVRIDKCRGTEKWYRGTRKKTKKGRREETEEKREGEKNVVVMLRRSMIWSCVCTE